MNPDPVTLAAALRNTLEDTERDFSSMPFREEAVRALIAWLG